MPARRTLRRRPGVGVWAVIVVLLVVIRAISTAAVRLRSANERTSDATTPKPLP